jgi:hypothetical protein
MHQQTTARSVCCELSSAFWCLPCLLQVPEGAAAAAAAAAATIMSK